jgi:hypothetical protein
MTREDVAVESAYRAPSADDDEEEPHTGDGALYLGPGKVALMYVATGGIYGVYWFYAHWAFYKRAFGMSIWPLARSIFSIFYVNQLFKTLDNQARQVGFRPSWSPGQQAGIYIALVLASRLVDRLFSASAALSFVALGAGLSAVLPLISAQKVANLAAGEDAASAARPFSFVDGVLLAIGCGFWALVFLGLHQLQSGASLE